MENNRGIFQRDEDAFIDFAGGSTPTHVRNTLLANVIVGFLFILLLVNMDIFVFNRPEAPLPQQRTSMSPSASPYGYGSPTEASSSSQALFNSPLGLRFISSSKYSLSFNIHYILERTSDYLISRNISREESCIAGRGSVNFLVQRTAFKPLSLSIFDIIFLHPSDNTAHELLLSGMNANDAHKASVVGSTNLQNFALISDSLAYNSVNAWQVEKAQKKDLALCTFSGTVHYLPDYKASRSLKIMDDQQFQSYKKLMDQTSEVSAEVKQSVSSNWMPTIAKAMNLEDGLYYNATQEDGFRNLGVLHDDWLPSENGTHLLPPPHVDIHGALVSSDCGFTIRFLGSEVDIQGLLANVNLFAISYHLKTIVEMRLIWQQMKHTSSLNSYVKVSTLSVLLGGLLTTIEASFLLFVGILSHSVVSYFAIMAFVKYVCFIMEMRFFSNTWREAHTNSRDDNNTLINLFRLYYFAVPCCIGIAYAAFMYFPPLLAIFYFVWLPQIISDIWFGYRNSVEPYYLFFMSIMRVAFPIYLFGVSNNLFMDEAFPIAAELPNPALAIAIGVTMGIQCFYAFLQKRNGPRYMVPHFLLPHVYNFHRPIPSFIYEQGTKECVICINKIDMSDLSSVCITPCDHLFHSKCLLQWMDVKMECPICRRVLPAYG